MPKTFMYKNVRGDSMNVYASGQAAYDAPRRRYTSIAIPGRNGNIIFDEGTYDNIIVKYDCVVPFGFQENAKRIRNWLCSSNNSEYYALQDDYDADHYRMARFNGELNFSPMYSNQSAAVFTASFECKPQRFLSYDDEYEIYLSKTQSSATIQNPTTNDADAEIIMTEVVEGQMLSIGGGTIITALESIPDEAVTIDTETGKIAIGNLDVSSKFDVRRYGDAADVSNIKLDGYTTASLYNAGTYSEVYIYPRWWEL